MVVIHHKYQTNHNNSSDNGNDNSNDNSNDNVMIIETYLI